MTETIEVRRESDHELCGRVVPSDGRWAATNLFGAMLGHHDDIDDAVRQVLADGLASLAERWTVRESASGEEQIACILEATPTSVTLALDYYPHVGVPTLTLTSAQLASGEWELRRS